jgi:hypothetical protein
MNVGARHAVSSGAETGLERAQHAVPLQPMPFKFKSHEAASEMQPL